ncbi:hypothetical protein JTE90_002700 [Oedothorax gibbosus]|uniref:Uncharacterized protein n=1 Tax=Oedothorax gibbosus TaxID=931172 RepID=A0AAV6VWR1_9ARAC|nr:hypothetical protein JTE90_002700 [Oedothorax gibbosus]
MWVKGRMEKTQHRKGGIFWVLVIIHLFVIAEKSSESDLMMGGGPRVKMEKIKEGEEMMGCEFSTAEVPPNALE